MVRIRYVRDIKFTHILSLFDAEKTFNQAYILFFKINVLGSSSVDLLMCRSWNFEYYVIFVMFLFQLLKTSLKLRKMLLVKVFLLDQ